MKKKIVQFVAPFLSLVGYCFIRLYLATIRTTLHISEETKRAIENKERGAILMVWHDSLLAVPLLSFLGAKRQVSILISKSRDGEIPAQIAHYFKGVRTIRVPGGARHIAVQESLKALAEKQMLLITPDGPRGPRRVMKAGTYFLAQKSDAALFTFRWTGSHILQLKTWDKFRIPLPFSRITASVQGPFEPTEEL